MLGRALDASQIAFSCYNNSVGGSRPATGIIGRLLPSGAINLDFFSVYVGNAGELGGVATRRLLSGVEHAVM